MTRNGGSKSYGLTWFAPRSCWKKKYKGKVFYCPIQASGKTDAAAYQKALAWWEEKRKAIDNANQQAAGYGVFGNLTEEQVREIGLSVQRKHYYEGDMTNPPSRDQWEQTQTALKFYAENKDKQAEKIDPSQTVDAFSKRFLDFKRSQAVSGQKSNGRFANLRTAVTQFVEFAGKEQSADKVQWALILNDYYQKQLLAIGEKKISETGARDKLQAARQFIRRLWEMGVIELPRNLDSKEMTIAASNYAIKLPPFDTFKGLVSSVPEIWGEYYPLKLYLLLMANCGMTQKDIADLKQSQVDWSKGIIRRKRSKTQKGNEGRIPTVQYQLWATTFALLQKYRSKNTDFVLVNRIGGSLRATTLNADADSMKSSNTDIIADQYNDWLNDKGITDAPSLKGFRKASASKLEEHNDYCRYSQTFLCNASKTTAEKHYVVPSQDRMDAAVQWLGEQYEQMNARPHKTKRKGV